MTPLMISLLGLLMVATALLFGMAGGLILIGVLLTLMPLPSAMVLHAITLMAANGWRALLWRSHIRWRPVAIYLADHHGRRLLHHLRKLAVARAERCAGLLIEGESR